MAERRAKAKRKMEKLRKKGKNIQPIEIEGRTIARSFWGKGWCEHLESFSDYENRLPRGRTYVRNGSVCHLVINSGRIEAMVAGSSLYTVSIAIKKLKPTAWKTIKKKCSGQIGSMLELLQGKLSDQVMGVVADQKDGLFPKPAEIELTCSCPDWAVMCKHVAAVLYGVGSRLDTYPELLFILRDVDAQELIAAELNVPAAAARAASDSLADDQLDDIFGIDIEPATKPEPRRRKKGASKKEASHPKAGKSRTSGGAPKREKALKKTVRQKQRTQTTRGSSGAANPSEGTKPRIRPTGKSVARMRKLLDLTIVQFAEKLSVSPATVYRWESIRGRIKLQAGSLSALAALHQQAKMK